MAKKKQKVEAEKIVEEVSAKRYLTMENGDKYEIVGESGKYYFCKGTQFRKGNPHIKEVI